MRKSFTGVPKVVFDIVVCLDASFEPLRCVTLLLYLSLGAVFDVSHALSSGDCRSSGGVCSLLLHLFTSSRLSRAAVVLIDFLRKSNLSFVIQRNLDCRN